MLPRLGRFDGKEGRSATEGRVMFAPPVDGREMPIDGLCAIEGDGRDIEGLPLGRLTWESDGRDGADGRVEGREAETDGRDPE
ncbi:MAG: hypothetical protein ACOY3P_23345 [Planctomycetota bacterium]